MYVQMHLQTALCYMYTNEIIFYTIFKIEHKLYIASVSAPTPRQWIILGAHLTGITYSVLHVIFTHWCSCEITMALKNWHTQSFEYFEKDILNTLYYTVAIALQLHSQHVGF